MSAAIQFLKHITAYSLFLSLPTLADLPSADPTPPAPILWLGANYSDVYGSFAHSEFANIFLNNENAAAFQLDYGTQEFLLALTWGHVINEKQRIKFSAEHFSQDNNFNFTSGEEHEFIGQNSIGAEYEYGFSNAWLRALTVNTYYFNANNGDLVQEEFHVGNTTFVNLRGLTGGTGGGLGIGPTWHLWKSGTLQVLAHYDTVNFPTQYEPALNTRGAGYSACFQQKLSQYLNLKAYATQRATYNQYQADLNWLAYHTETQRLTLSLEGSHLNSSVLPAGNENIIGLNLAYQWASPPSSPRSLNTNNTQNTRHLLNWTGQSAAHVPGVFVQVDQWTSLF